MEIKSFIICEDIRREVGNKLSIMGVLNEGINYDGPEANVWPKAMNIATFIRLSIKEDDPIPSSFLLKVTLDSDEVAKIQGDVSIPKGTKILNIPLTMYGCPLKSAGMLVFNFKALSQENVLIEAENTLRVT